MAGRSQRHKVEEQGYSSGGKIYEQGAINDQILKAIGGVIGSGAPTLSSLSPSTAVHGGADFTLNCIGTGFTNTCVIVFNGGEEPTTFVSPTSVTTLVKPSLVSAAIVVPVQVVKGGALGSEVRNFTFT
jgi:hypothetical protein